MEDGLLARAAGPGGEGPGPPGGHCRRRFELIGDVRGKGPMLAMELVRDRERKTPAGEETRELVKLCFERGLVLLSADSTAT